MQGPDIENLESQGIIPRMVRTVFSRIETAFRQHLDDDKKMGLGISQLDDRLRTVERLVWIAVGGIVVIGASIPIGMSIIIHYMK